MNIVVKLEEASVGVSSLMESVMVKLQAALEETPKNDHFLFFKKAVGPVRCSSVQIMFDGLLQKATALDEWELCKCMHCSSYVFARHAVDATTNAPVSALTTCLVNSSLMTTDDKLYARTADENYSPAFGIVLNRSSPSYSDLTEKGKLLSKVNNDDQFVQRLRAYMEQETEAVSERIQRFTEQEFALLKVKRERAEQDCLILAKLAVNNQVPDELQLVRSNCTSLKSSSNNSGGLVGTVPSLTATTTTPSNTTNVNDTTVNSQLETPPPTPEYLPMSTGNSPPMTVADSGAVAHSRQHPITPSSSSSMVDQSSYTSPSARMAGLTNSRTPNRANLSYNSVDNHSYNSNNNNSVSFNNSRGAISRQQSQRQTASMQQHSSTNSMTMLHHQQPHRLTSYESDCMFDIDGMENDNSPRSNTFSDEEDIGFDESIGNNNEDGMYIPSRQLGAKNSSIARSLPISMPQLMTQFRSNEEDFEEMNEDNVDIAASIKALARSVHGDTVFGDLPRPQVQRFNTQI